MVEALTIVLAVGVTRGWPSVRLGVLAALAALAVVVVVLGSSLSLIPIGILRLVVGAFLLIFGMQWLRKAILRASGFTPLHDEEHAYRREIELARHAGPVHRTGVDWYAFTLSFKGVFLEGIEVAFIVLTFGSTGGISVAATGATAALVLVGAAGLLVHEPLSRVPENMMKFAVGLLLTTFGIFWGGEGVGIAWPGGDAALVVILAFMTVCSAGLVNWLSGDRKRRPATVAAKSE
jgi:uncharacterized membrane protein